MFLEALAYHTKVLTIVTDNLCHHLIQNSELLFFVKSIWENRILKIFGIIDS
jgi:hypothetical protein